MRGRLPIQGAYIGEGYLIGASADGARQKNLPIEVQVYTNTDPRHKRLVIYFPSYNQSFTCRAQDIQLKGSSIYNDRTLLKKPVL